MINQVEVHSEIRAFAALSKDRGEVACLEGESLLVVRRWGREEQVAAIFHFGDAAASADVPLPCGRWLKRLASGEERWNGPGRDLPSVFHRGGKVSVTLTIHAFLIVSLQAED
ncbi:MAG: hypothetical protein ABFD97_20080 [Syntrophobacter sp.]